MLDMVFFAVVAGGLYFLTGRILETIEHARGERLPQRNVFFFLIILLLSVVSFAGLQWLLEPPA